MSGKRYDVQPAAGEQAPTPGLTMDELRAEQVDALPERDALSVIGLGGITGGLPPVDILDGVLDSDLPIGAQPVDGQPVEPYPGEQLPPVGLPLGPPEGLPSVPAPDTLPSLDVVDERIDNLPIDTILDGASADATTVAADADVSAEV
jgi:hypothetical protein